MIDKKKLLARALVVSEAAREFYNSTIGNGPKTPGRQGPGPVYITSRSKQAIDQVNHAADNLERAINDYDDFFSKILNDGQCDYCGGRGEVPVDRCFGAVDEICLECDGKGVIKNEEGGGAS